MRRWLHLVVGVGILALGLIAVAPRLDVGTSRASTASEVGISAASPTLPNAGACLRSPTRCSPANPPVATGSSLWPEATLFVGLVAAFITGSRRIRGARTRAAAYRNSRHDPAPSPDTSDRWLIPFA